MRRLTNMMSGGAGKGGAGSIREFVKKNPDFMKLSGDKRHEALMDYKMETRQMERAAAPSPARSFGAPGQPQPEKKEMSKSAKLAIEQMQQKQMKKLAKRKKELIAIRACWFGNGRVDSKGIIYNAANQVVGQVDPKTFEVSIGFKKLGKYKDSSFMLDKLNRAVAGIPVKGAPAANAVPGANTVWGKIEVGNFFGTQNSSNNGWW